MYCILKRKKVQILLFAAISVFILLVPSCLAEGAVLISDAFPDPQVQENVRKDFDKNDDGRLSEAEIADAKEIEWDDEDIESMQGIQCLTSLQVLVCHSNPIGSLDISNNTALTNLVCFDCELSELDVSNNPLLVEIVCEDNPIESLDVTNNAKLEQLWVGECGLSDLDVSHNPALHTLGCAGNQLSVLDVSNNPNLIRLDCQDNPLNTLDIHACPTLVGYVEDYAPIARNTWVQYGPVAPGQREDRQHLRVGANVRLVLQDGVFIDDVFPDPQACANVHNDFDMDKDGYLSEAEIANAKVIEWDNEGIESMQGIEVLTSLEVLICPANPIEVLDVSHNPMLKRLVCADTPLASLDVSNNPLLEAVEAHHCRLTSVTLGRQTHLRELRLGYNQIEAIDVSGCSDMRILVLRNNALRALDVSACTKLENLQCQRNQIRVLTLGNQPNLFELSCGINKLTALDVTGCPKLYTLVCDGNDFATLDISKCPDMLGAYNGKQEYDLEENLFDYRNTSNANNMIEIDTDVIILTGNDLFLPDGLQRIENEAFASSGCGNVIVPDGCDSIGNRAFANCGILHLYVPQNTISADDAFENCDKVIIIER